MKRFRAPVEEKEEKDVENYEVDEDELVQEAVAAGLIGIPKQASRDVNHKGALLESFRSFAQDLPWIERLEVVSADPIVGVSSSDDLNLELAFYSQSLAAISAARAELERLSVPHRRPTDYLAEMLKSDGHMKRTKDKLLLEQERLAAVEVRKRQQEAEKFRKSAHAEKLREKAVAKRQDAETTKQWRKHGVAPPEARREGGAGGSGGTRHVKGGDNGAGRRGEGRGGVPSGATKRARKDEKYGFGGVRKRTYKENTSKSTKDLSSFSVAKMKRGGGGGGKRPGKSARAASRGRGRSSGGR